MKRLLAIVALCAVVFARGLSCYLVSDAAVISHGSNKSVAFVTATS